MIKTNKKFVRKSSIRDIDASLYDWFDKKLNISIEDEHDNRKKVEIIMATGEKWALIKNRRKLRDSNNALILPLISIRRVNFENEQDMWALGRFENCLSYSKVLNSETSNRANLFQNRRTNKYSVKNSKIPVYEMIRIPYPKFIKINYQVQIWTNYISHMNEILEYIWTSRDEQSSGTNHIVLESNGNKYLMLLDPNSEDGSNLEEFSDVERIIRSTINFKVLGYIIKKNDQNNFETSVPCVSEIAMDEKIITDSEEIKRIF